MRDDLVNIYDAGTLAEAQMLVARLEDEGIRTYIDKVNTPLDGLTSSYQVKEVRVLAEDEARAREVVAAFEAEVTDAPADDEA